MTYDLDRAIGFWLNRCFNRLRAVSVRRLEAAGFDLTPEHWAVLVRLWEQDGLSQQELGDATFRDRSVITRLVDGLERRGWVRREPDPRDRRVHRLALTDAAHAQRGALTETVRAIVADAFVGVSEADLETTRRVLMQVYANLEADHGA